MSANLHSSKINIQLAPMEGVVDPVIRELFSEIGGYDRMVTEFVRVSQHPVPPGVFQRFCPELLNHGKTTHHTPVFVQLLGGDPQKMAESALIAQNSGAIGIDVNFGCPAKTVNRHDGGAALLKNPHRLYDVLTQIKASISIPLTAKVRLGFDHKDFVKDIAQAVNDSGAASLTVHARTKIEGYRPPAHWEYIAIIKDTATKIPVYANGDIWTFQDYERCKKISGCQNIAIGRPAMAQPDLALIVKSNGTLTKFTSDQLITEWLPKFIKLSLEYRHSQYALIRLKQWTKLLGRNYPELQHFFEAIKRFKNLEELLEPITYSFLNKNISEEFLTKLKPLLANNLDKPL